MLQTIFVCSIVSAIFSAVSFIFVVNNDTTNQQKIIRLSLELKRTKSELSSERSKRIKAESDAAYYHDHYYIPELDPTTPDFNNF